jgi:Flavodoxin
MEGAAMRALVVFESMFGNTEEVARAVAEGLSSRMDVSVRAVSEAPDALPEPPVLVVVGGPTHVMGMTRARTRADAVRQGAAPATGATTGLREWLAGLRWAPAGTAGAAFDTRVHAPVPGSAARGAARGLRRLGVALAAPATTFWVGGTPGPLLDGERERARRWGEDLAAAVVGTGAAASR